MVGSQNDHDGPSLVNGSNGRSGAAADSDAGDNTLLHERLSTLSLSTRHNRDDDSWITEVVQRHRCVIRELLQNHRESVQVRRKTMTKKNHENAGLLVEHQHYNNSSDIHLRPTDDVIVSVMNDASEGAAGTSFNGVNRAVWSREMSIKNLHNYNDRDFILIHRDHCPEAPEEKQQEPKLQSSDRSESFAISDNKHNHDDYCAIDVERDSESSKEPKHTSTGSGTAIDEPYDQHLLQQQQLAPLEKPTASKATRSNESSSKHHVTAFRLLPVTILSLSDLPTCDLLDMIESKEINDDREMVTSRDQNIIKEEERKIELILDSMNDQIESFDKAGDQKDNKSEENIAVNDMDYGRRSSEEEQAAIDDILDGFFGEMDSLDEIEISEGRRDTNKPLFPSPPRPIFLSNGTDDDDDDDDECSSDSVRSTSEASSDNKSSHDDDDPDDSNESSSSISDKNSCEFSKPSSSSDASKSDKVNDREDGGLIASTSITSRGDEVRQQQEKVDCQQRMTEPSFQDELDDTLVSFLEETNSTDANDHTEDVFVTKKRPSVGASQVSDSSSEDSSDVNVSSESGINRSSQRSETSKDEALTSNHSYSSPLMPPEESKKTSPIAIGGEDSAFTTSATSSYDRFSGVAPMNDIPRSSFHNGSVTTSPHTERRVVIPPGTRLDDLLVKKSHGAISPFTPLFESKSRIATPDLNIATHEDAVPIMATSDIFSRHAAEDYGLMRPHDPVASALSQDLSDLPDGKANDYGKIQTDSLTENDPTLVQEVRDGDLLSSSDQLNSEDESTSSHLSPDVPIDNGDRARPSSPCRATSPIPDFEVGSVSTMSPSPVSHLIGLDRKDMDDKIPESMVPVIDIAATSATFLPDLWKSDHKRNDDDDEEEDNPARKTNDEPTSKPAAKTSLLDPDVPFLRTNMRMDRRMHKHKDMPSSPHKVETSRTPFCDANSDDHNDTGASTTAFSTPGRASTVRSSIRGFHSLASPPRSNVRPSTTTPSSIRVVSRTPTDSKSIAKSEQVLRQKIAAPSYHNQSVRVCTNKFIYNLHPKLGPCDRCWALASRAEQERFLERGSHLRIVRTRGGCDRTCNVFPPLRTFITPIDQGQIKGVEDEKEREEPPIRLCRQCFFATHQLDGSRVSVYKGNHIKVKSTL